MQGFVLAARYLTIVPLPGRVTVPADALGRGAVWFPVVGAVIGLAVVVTERATRWLFPSLLAALLTVTVWKLLTGGLHLDGLADCLDGLTGRDAEHRLAIMRDSRIGAFGAMGLILFLGIEVAAVAELAPADRRHALLLAPVVGRAMPPVLARLFRPARRDGHGAAFASGLTTGAALVALGLALVLSLALLGAAGLVAFALALLVSLLIGRFLAGRLSGITGDVLGASVETAELAVLLALSAWTHLPP